MLVRNLTVAVCFVLSACATAADVAAPMPLSASDEEMIKAGVRRRLRDPASAQFEDIVVGRSPRGETFACGVVNAKNVMGGYAGRAPFYGVMTGGEFAVASLGDADGGLIQHGTIRALCKAHGVPLPERRFG